MIAISSLESPHIRMERSPWGLADRTWLEKQRSDYGEGSLWWTCHVLGLFPDSGTDSVIPISWLEAATMDEGEPVRRRGATRMAIDLATGGGGDRTVILVRDDDNLLACWHSRTSSFEATATQAALMAQRWDVPPGSISWDVEGIGADFANRLEAVGIRGARAYRGGDDGGRKFFNLRAAAAWALRRRLDPKRMLIFEQGGQVPQPPFRIPRPWMRLMLEELAGLRYEHGDKGEIKLETKEDFSLRLRHSPDFADCMGQLFAFL